MATNETNFDCISFAPRRVDFFRECNQLASIRDANISKVIGICSKDDPVSALQEYSEFGDLPKFLRLQVESDDENTNPILKSVVELLVQPRRYSSTTIFSTNHDAFVLLSFSINFLLYLAAQIASAMKYLESRKIVHRDLAAR